MKIAKSSVSAANAALYKKPVDLSQTTLYSSVDLNLPDDFISTAPQQQDFHGSLKRNKLFKTIPQFSEPRFSELSRSSVDRSSLSERTNKTVDYIFVTNATTNNNNNNYNSNNINRKLLK
jgi:hypothetical protein